MALFNQAALALARGNHPGARELALKVRATLAQAGIGLAADDEVELHRLEQTLLGTTTDRR